MQVSPRWNVPLRARRTIHIPPPRALACASFPVWRLLIATAVPARARAPGYLETSCPWRLAVDHETRRLRARGLVPAGRHSCRKLGMRPKSGWIARVLEAGVLRRNLPAGAGIPAEVLELDFEGAPGYPMRYRVKPRRRHAVSTTPSRKMFVKWTGMRRSRRDREAGLPYEERLIGPEDQPSDSYRHL